MLIAIDHGNKQIKTVHCPPIVSGLQKSSAKPFGREVLKYGDSYYTLSAQRIPYRKDKTTDERFFVLSLFAIAREIGAQDAYSEDLICVQLAVGLPPAHFGAQNKAFTEYFQGREVIRFEYRGKPYIIYIEDVVCYPQAYAAAVTMLRTLAVCPRVLVLDIGGFTADYLLLKNGQADLSTCDSLENGVILLYNRIRSKANSDLDLIVEESDVDTILQGKDAGYDPMMVQMVEQQAQEFVDDLFGTLRERMLDLRSGKVVFVGGGASLLRRQIDASGRVGAALYVDDIKANVKGFEYLCQRELAGR